MTSGLGVFARFAFPPNALGYCGPSDVTLLQDLAAGDAAAERELRHVAMAFAGAWPYLELVGHSVGLHPLDRGVVEAYWMGNDLLGRMDLHTWGNSLDDRFRRRAGTDWDAIRRGLESGGRPNHAFHVFCVYPWVGLLRSGAVGPALEVLDQCRIRWGTVEGVVGEKLLVRSQSLKWDGRRLGLGALRTEMVDASVDPEVSAEPGDAVALHWNYVCQVISPLQVAALQREHTLHLAIVNGDRRRLAETVER